MKVPISICPACGAPNDGAKQVLGIASPIEGDLSICMYCGHLAIFRPDMTLRDVTTDELAVIMRDNTIATILRMRRQAFGDDGYPLKRKFR